MLTLGTEVNYDLLAVGAATIPLIE